MITDTLITLYTYTIGFIVHNMPTVEALPELIDSAFNIIYGNFSAVVFYIPPMQTVVNTMIVIFTIEAGIVVYAIISKHILKHG